MAIKIGVMLFFNFCFHFRANTKTNFFFIKKKHPQMLKKNPFNSHVIFGNFCHIYQECTPI